METASEVLQTQAPVQGAHTSMLALVTEADLVVQLTLVVLVFMSISCWAIILLKWRYLAQADRESAQWSDLFWAGYPLDKLYEQVGRFSHSPLVALFKAGYQAIRKLPSDLPQAEVYDHLFRILRRAKLTQTAALERFIPFLATTGATAPFIGLFGTVWGILRAFQKLGTAKAATIQVVGPDIAHALIATAVGLVAAIPAVWAYNYFQHQIHLRTIDMEHFADDLLNRIKHGD